MGADSAGVGGAESAGGGAESEGVQILRGAESAGVEGEKARPPIALLAAQQPRLFQIRNVPLHCPNRQSAALRNRLNRRVALPLVIRVVRQAQQHQLAPRRHIRQPSLRHDRDTHSRTPLAPASESPIPEPNCLSMVASLIGTTSLG